MDRLMTFSKDIETGPYWMETVNRTDYAEMDYTKVMLVSSINEINTIL